MLVVGLFMLETKEEYKIEKLKNREERVLLVFSLLLAAIPYMLLIHSQLTNQTTETFTVWGVTVYPSKTGRMQTSITTLGDGFYIMYGDHTSSFIVGERYAITYHKDIWLQNNRGLTLLEVKHLN